MKVKSAEHLVKVGLIAITPLVYVIALVVLDHQKHEYKLGPNQDPDYAYLMNSLAIANAQTPGHTDHPGTPVQIFGAVTLWLHHAAASALQSVAGQPTLGLNEAVLTNPESYLDSINFALLGLSAASLFALGLTLFLLSNRLLPAVLVQLTPLLLVKTISANEPSRVAPEAVIFLLTQVLATLLVVYLFRRNVEKTRWFAVSFGIIFGLGMATKVTFLPTIIFGLAIAGYRLKLLALGLSVVTFVVATLPIVSEYGRVWQWMTGIILNNGKYASGDRGLAAADTLNERLATLFEKDTVFFYILGVASALCLMAIISMLLRSVSRSAQERAVASPSAELETKRRRLTLWLTLALWSQVLVTINEFAHSRYLILAVGLCGLLLVLAVMWIESIALYRNRIPRSLPVACLLIYALCLGSSVQQYSAAYEQVSSKFDNRLQQVQEIETLLGQPQYQGCVLALERRASAIPSVLFYGNRWSNSAFSETLSTLYPEAVFVLRSSIKRAKPFRFVDYDSREVSTAEILERGNGCILFQGKSMLKGENTRQKVASDAVVEDLLPGQRETLHRVYISDKTAVR